MQAKTIVEALNLFDPHRPLLDEPEIKYFFVARANSPLIEMITILESAADFPKILLSGSPGCGKSTELAKLREKLKKKFHIIYCSAKNVTNDFNIDIGGLLFFIFNEIAKIAKNEKLSIYSSKLERFLQYGYGWEMNIEQATSAKGPELAVIPSPIEKLAKKGLDSEVTLKYVLKKTAKSGPDDIIGYINDTIWELEGKTGKDVLVIVTDMDKISLDNAKELFIEKYLYLTKLNCFGVFTFPLALKYEPNFIRAARNFSGIYYLPNFTVFDQYDIPDETGQKQLREIVTKRVRDRMIYDEALNRIVELSGGIAFELINIVRQCCIQSLVEKINYIDEEIVITAEDKIRRFYNSVYSPEELSVLASIRHTKKFEQNDTGIKLLNHLSISEYGTADDIWYDINPILLPLLRETEEDAE